MSSSVYQPPPSVFDEAFHPDGTCRPDYETPIAYLNQSGISNTREALSKELSSRHVAFGDESKPYEVDPVPRIIDAAEWSGISRGLAQRHDAINSFLLDAYGDRSLVAEGIMPMRVLTESIYYEPIMARAGTDVVAQLAGPDLIRDESGQMLVLEDNVRTPSGIAYASACRKAAHDIGTFAEPSMLDPAPAYEVLRDVFREADPAGGGDPSVVILSEGTRSKAWFEHRDMSERLDIPVVDISRLECRRGRLFARVDERSIEVHVLYNRSDDERLRRPDGQLSRLGYLLKDPLEAGRLGCVNSFGAGIADDKATHCYVEEMIRFYLNEQPLLRSVPSFDLGDRDQRSAVTDHLKEFVIKPRWSFGGQGIILGPHATTRELEEVEVAISRNPSHYVAQKMINFSVHPTAVGDQLEPRHVDLRAFVAKTAAGSSILPVALTRFAGSADDLVVNSTQGGGAKDTWLLR